MSLEKRYLIEVDNADMEDIGIPPRFSIVEATGIEDPVYLEGESPWLGMTLEELEEAYSKPEATERLEFQRRQILKLIIQVKNGEIQSPHMNDE